MKKIFLISAAMLVLNSCGNNKALEAEQDYDAANITSYENAVVELANDNAYRPGIKPSEPTVIDFNASWCGPCRQFKPVFHGAAPKFPDVRFVSVDVDRLTETARAYGVTAVPTVVFIKTDGRATTFVGTNDIMPAERFYNVLDSVFRSK